MTISLNGRRRLSALLFTALTATGLGLAASGTASAEPAPPPVDGTATGIDGSGLVQTGEPEAVYFFSDFLKIRVVSVCYQDPGKGRVCEKVVVRG